MPALYMSRRPPAPLLLLRYSKNCVTYPLNQANLPLLLAATKQRVLITPPLSIQPNSEH